MARRTTGPIGDGAHVTTLALLLVALAGRPGWPVRSPAEIVTVLLAPLARSLVDRLPRVQVLVTADLVRVLPATPRGVARPPGGRDAFAVGLAIVCGTTRSSSLFRPPDE